MGHILPKSRYMFHGAARSGSHPYHWKLYSVSSGNCGPLLVGIPVFLIQNVSVLRPHGRMPGYRLMPAREPTLMLDREPSPGRSILPGSGGPASVR
jgi:hypothetical protein